MNGKLIIKVNDYLLKNKISRSSVCRNGDIRYDTLLTYCRGTVTRLDVETLEKLCSVLNCKIQDIIEFIPNKK